jgi:hypothetical protein
VRQARIQILARGGDRGRRCTIVHSFHAPQRSVLPAFVTPRRIGARAPLRVAAAPGSSAGARSNARASMTARISARSLRARSTHAKGNAPAPTTGSLVANGDTVPFRPRRCAQPSRRQHAERAPGGPLGATIADDKESAPRLPSAFFATTRSGAFAYGQMWLPVVDAFRTIVLAPSAEVRQLFVGMRGFAMTG